MSVKIAPTFPEKNIKLKTKTQQKPKQILVKGPRKSTLHRTIKMEQYTNLAKHSNTVCREILFYFRPFRSRCQWAYLRLGEFQCLNLPPSFLT